MTFSESNLKKVLNLIPHSMEIRSHGCFRLTVSSNWKHSEQNNHDQHILFVKSGKGIYYFKDKEEILEPGKIVYISNGCPHHAWYDKANPLVITGLRFGFYTLNQEKIHPLPCSPFHLSIRVEDIEFYDKLFVNINSYYYSIHQKVSQLLCSSMITHILSEILYRYEINQKNTTIQDSRIERVQRYMMNDLSSSSSIEELASRVHMSSRHLRYCFKQKYGMTPKQYQLKIRMNHARFLLETSDLPIGKIALSLGYSDQFVFSRQFKSIYGFPPSHMRSNK